MKLHYIIATLFVAVALTACEHNHSHEKDDHDHENCSEQDHNDAVASINSVTFTKAQQAKINFATEEIQPVPFGQIIRTTAQIQSSQGDERIVAAKTNGAVVFNSNVTEGKTVSAGQTLFTIDGSATADNNLAVRYAQAESEYNRAKAEYERTVKLAEKEIASQSELLQAKTDFVNAEAVYNNLRRNFSTGRQNIASPISGYVTRVLVQNGQFVETGQPIVIVSQNRDLFIKAELQPRFFDLLGNITSANIRVVNSNRIYYLGLRLLSYGKSVDINNPLIPVFFQINNVEQEGFSPLLPGSFVELFIKTQTNTQALTVPNEAIVEEMGNFFIFVQHSPELFEKRLVHIGVTDGLRTEIQKGVSAGETVVSKGAILVKLAQGSGALDPHAGHAH